MTFGGTFSEINLNSSIIDVIILTKIILIAFKLEVRTGYFLEAHDFKGQNK